MWFLFAAASTLVLLDKISKPTILRSNKSVPIMSLLAVLANVLNAVMKFTSVEVIMAIYVLATLVSAAFDAVKRRDVVSISILVTFFFIGVFDILLGFLIDYTTYTLQLDWATAGFFLMLGTLFGLLYGVFTRKGYPILSQLTNFMFCFCAFTLYSKVMADISWGLAI